MNQTPQPQKPQNKNFRAPFFPRLMGSLAGAFMMMSVGDAAVLGMTNAMMDESCHGLMETMQEEGRLHLNPDLITGELSPDQQKVQACIGPAQSYGFVLSLAFVFAGVFGGGRVVDHVYRRKAQKNGNGPHGPSQG